MDHALIVAYGQNKEIGYHGQLPWHLPTDLQHFKQLTLGHTVVMGRKTYDSIGHALPKRNNIVVSRQTELSLPDAHVVSSLSQALLHIPTQENLCFYIGGAQVYAAALLFATRLYITEVDYTGPADTYFPEFDNKTWQLTHFLSPDKKTTDEYSLTFKTYNRIRPLTHLNPNQ